MTSSKKMLKPCNNCSDRRPGLPIHCVFEKGLPICASCGVPFITKPLQSAGVSVEQLLEVKKKADEYSIEGGAIARAGHVIVSGMLANLIDPALLTQRTEK